MADVKITESLTYDEVMRAVVEYVCRKRGLSGEVKASTTFASVRNEGVTALVEIKAVESLTSEISAKVQA